MLPKLLPYGLVLHSSILLVWGVLGLLEFFVPAATFGFQEPNFPWGTQLLHWILITGTGVVFVTGFFTRWRYTPFATITMYATLATLCWIETFDFDAWGGGPTRFIPMAVEFTGYLVFSTYLLRSETIARRFGGAFAAVPPAAVPPAAVPPAAVPPAAVPPAPVPPA